MSNCSNSTERIEVDGSPLGNNERIVRLLRAMSLEWADLSGRIAELGATLSAQAAREGALHLVQDMQAFDALSQRAFSQFRLLERISHELGGYKADNASSIEELIEQLPFLDLKHWFLQALKGEDPVREKPETLDEESQSVLWLE
jgi:hypothetical protein